MAYIKLTDGMDLTLDDLTAMTFQQLAHLRWHTRQTGLVYSKIDLARDFKMTESRRKAQATMKARRGTGWPEEKQRGTRKDWRGILPDECITNQKAWERRETALKMRKAGMMYKEIAPFFGVSTNRARQLVTDQERMKCQGRLSPAEYYFREEPAFKNVTSLMARKIKRFARAIDERDWLFDGPYPPTRQQF